MGPRYQSTDGLFNLPRNVSSRIRSVRLILSAKDLVGRSVRDYEDRVDLLLNVYRFHTQCHQYEAWLNDNWSGKIKTVCGFPLESLVLYVSDAFAPNGTFLDLGDCFLFNFRYGIPRHSEIIAPDEQLADIVRRRIRLANSEKAWLSVGP